MTFLATTTVSVLRGTTRDQYGDETDTDTAVRSGVPASIIERTQRVVDPASSRSSVVHYVVGRVAGNVDVRDGDRIRDECTAVVYAVSSTNQAQNPAMGLDVRLDLSRVT